MKNYWTHLKESINYFKNAKIVKYLSIMSFFTLSAIAISLSMSSVYFEKILIPISFIGVLAFVASMITAFTSKKADKWEEKLGEAKSLFLIQLFLVLGVFLISLMIPHYGYFLYLLIPFISGFNGVVIGNYINHHIETSHRATLLSIKGMFGNIGIFLLFPFIGYIEKITNFGFSFVILGIILLVGFILLYLYSKKLNLKFSKSK